MKKIVLFILVISMVVTSSVFAIDIPDNDVYEILSNMGVMTYQNGNFHAGATLTRAQMAKILVLCSPYKDMVSENARISPFPDVSYKNWSSTYVYVAATNKIMQGYSDGYFRPNRTVKYDEAITAVLKLLGYSGGDFIGGYPSGQRALAKNLNLVDGLNTTTFEGTISRGETARMIYNALNLKMKGKQLKLAETLGYKITGDNLSLSDISDVNAKGPVTIKGIEDFSKVGLRNPKIYIDGKSAIASQVTPWSVLYYNMGSNTAFIYTEKKTGIVNSVLPNKESPTSIVLSGTTLKLSSYAAQKAFSFDGLQEDVMVTCLLDKNGNVADAYLTSQVYSEVSGVVIAYGSDTNGEYVTILETSGQKYNVYIDNSGKAKLNKPVIINYKENVPAITVQADNSVSGKYDMATKTLGRWSISENINIIELSRYNQTITLSKTRLNGVNIEREEILLTKRDKNGVITDMIIKDVTNDMNKFGRITEIVKPDNDNPVGYIKYEVVLTGEKNPQGFVSAAEEMKKVSIMPEVGPIMLEYNGTTLVSMKNLFSLQRKTTFLSPEYIQTEDGKKYPMSPNVLVYKVGKTVTPSTIEEAMKNTTICVGFYDKEIDQGGQIRAIYIGGR